LTEEGANIGIATLQKAMISVQFDQPDWPYLGSKLVCAWASKNMGGFASHEVLTFLCWSFIENSDDYFEEPVMDEIDESITEKLKITVALDRFLRWTN